MQTTPPIKLIKTMLSLDRAYALNYSLQIEHHINMILSKAFSFGIKSNISFGDSSRALSFNHKLALLFDLESITSNDQKVLIKFSEIRNKFAHVLECHSMITCLTKTESLIFLEKKYKLGLDYSNNDNCNLLFESLIVDIEEILTKLYKKLRDSEFDAGKAWISIKITEQLIKAKSDNTFFNDIAGDTKAEIISNFLSKIVTELEPLELHSTDAYEILKKQKLL